VDDAMVTGLHEHHRHHQHGGITQFVELSLDTLGEDATRHDKVQELQAALHLCMGPVEALEEPLLHLVADGVAAGTVDLTKVDAAAQALEQSAETIHACVAAPLNALHATLLAPERAELGEKVRAHWEVWRQENHDAALAAKDPGSRLADLAAELHLDQARVAQLSTALAALARAPAVKFDVDQVQRQVIAFGGAFVGDAFDATRVTTNSTAYLTSHGSRRMARFYATVTPLLTPEERTTLAAHLREHADHHPAGASR
jgi:hypothetical protein